MNNKNKSLPIYYMGQILDQLDYWQINSEDWLSEHHLSRDKIRDFDNTIDYQTYESLITSAVDISQQPALGLYVGQRIGITTHGMMGYAMMNSASLREAIDVFIQFINTRTPLVSVELEESSTSLILSFKKRMGFDAIESTFLEALLLTFNNVLLQISFNEADILKINFCYQAPHYKEKYQAFFQCPVAFKQPDTQLIISSKGLDAPLKMSDPTSQMQARKLCEQELKKIKGLDSLSDKIKELILTSIGHTPNLEQTAQRFHMSARTLHRHLKQEGTSFKVILEDVTHHLAKEYLKNSTLSIQEIAYLLGYSDHANFRRAFKRWQGMAPSEFREQH